MLFSSFVACTRSVKLQTKGSVARRSSTFRHRKVLDIPGLTEAVTLKDFESISNLTMVGDAAGRLVQRIKRISGVCAHHAAQIWSRKGFLSREL